MAGSLLLNLSFMCNTKCPFCLVFDSLNDRSKDMSDEQVYAAIRQAHADGTREVGYTGGEPTVHPRIVEFIEYAKGLGYDHQSMNSNGIRFKDKQVCRDIIGAGLTSLDLSIHGHTDELHDRLVARPGALKAIRQGCEHLVGLQEEYRFHLSGTVVITRDNYPHLREICAMLDGMGIGHKRLKYAYEGTLHHQGLVEQVAPYQEVVAALTDALDYLIEQKPYFHVTHIPLCLLGDYAAFSRDFERQNTRMVFKDAASEGDPAQYLRKAGDACTGCVAREHCTRLDASYLRRHGRPELKPFHDEAELDALFARAKRRFPKKERLVGYMERLYRESRRSGEPAQAAKE